MHDRIEPSGDQSTWLENAAEYITDDGRRFAWSESNCRYEEVPPDGGSFTMLRRRLEKAEALIAEFVVACEGALLKFKHSPLDKVSVAADMLRAAIAKAKGGA